MVEVSELPSTRCRPRTRPAAARALLAKVELEIIAEPHGSGRGKHCPPHNHDQEQRRTGTTEIGVRDARQPRGANVEAVSVPPDQPANAAPLPVTGRLWARRQLRDGWRYEVGLPVYGNGPGDSVEAAERRVCVRSSPTAAQPNRAHPQTPHPHHPCPQPQQTTAGNRHNGHSDAEQLPVERQPSRSAANQETAAHPGTRLLTLIDPEGAYWRRGIEAATRWLRETGSDRLRVPYAYEAPLEWGGVGGYPLGRWLASQRTAYADGTLEAGRVVELEKLGMVRSERDAAWEDGLEVARLYAEAHGHFVPTTNAVWGDFPIGVWAKNARAAARRARENDELRAAGQPVPSSAGAMTQARQDELDAVDPGWCPAWDTTWQRRLRLVQAHVRAGGALPAAAGDVVVQGEDLGRWVAAQRDEEGWGRLVPAQRLLLESLGIEPAGKGEAGRPVLRGQDAKWAANLAAARQFHAREAHLRVPRKHIKHLAAETVPSGRQNDADGLVEIKLGTWLDNVRKRADKLTEQRRADLDALGMRW
ncbi:helicase associated domain-containing protein [Streptomyces sp. NPDC001455]|uniref:helicase associated domain-containing protein n=1 Tax=unclassified Streptomyces TaxID=2593676 RepID=UPI0033197AE8